jgi:phage terminase large subunit
VFNEIVKCINAWGLKDQYEVNKSDLVITCENGYQILFAGCDDAEKLKSITPGKGVLTDIWYEEATEADPADLKQLEKRLRGLSKYPKRITLSFNPIIQTHWIYKKYFECKWVEGSFSYREPGVSILKTTYKDNKFLSPDDIAALENETDKYYYEVYSLGNWGCLGGLIFKNWSQMDLSEEVEGFDNFYNGLDFGFANDPAAMVRLHWSKKSNTIYVVDELYAKELTNDVLAYEVKQKCGKEVVWCDSAEPKSIMELCQHGVTAIKAKKGKDSVNFGIQWLQQQRIVVDLKCQNMINELSQYKWKEDKDGTTVPIPVDRNNHLIDSMRYCLYIEMGLLERERPVREKSYLERRYESLGIPYKKAIKNRNKAGYM